MRTRTFYSRLLLFLLFGQLLMLLPESLQADEPPVPPPELILQSRAANISLVLGRLTMDPSQYVVVKREYIDSGSNTHEYFCVSASFGIPSLHYCQMTPVTQLVIDIKDSTDVAIRETRRNEGRTQKMEFFQPHDGLITLRVSDESAVSIDVQATSWWHLYLEHPDACEKWLTPIACRLIQNFRPKECLSELHQSLYAQLAINPTFDRNHISDLISQLGSDRNQDRSQAQQQLLALGVGILPIIEQFKHANLDAEQRGRLVEIHRKLRPHVSDSSRTLAMWLTADHKYWLALAPRWPIADRIAVNTRMKAACGVGLPAELHDDNTDPSVIVAAKATNRK